MNLLVQASGHRVVPGQRFGPISQFFPTTASEQGTQTVFPDGQVPQHLQGLKQDRNRHRIEHNRGKRSHHLDQNRCTKWNDSLLVRVGFYRLIQRMGLVERDHVGILTRRGDSRGCPPWVHLLSSTPGSWHEAGIGG